MSVGVNTTDLKSLCQRIAIAVGYPDFSNVVGAYIQVLPDQVVQIEFFRARGAPEVVREGLGPFFDAMNHATSELTLVV